MNVFLKKFYRIKFIKFFNCKEIYECSCLFFNFFEEYIELWRFSFSI